jgi:LSD1 subclass zinc finger protein
MGRSNKKKIEVQSGLSSFKCEQCGAVLNYIPGETRVECSNCGFTQQIEVSAFNIEEADYFAFLGTKEAHSPKIQLKTQECKSCGAVISFAEDLVAETCSFCGTNHAYRGGSTSSGIKPQFIAPFAIPPEKLDTLFRKWVRRRFWAPNDLKKLASRESFKAVYLPCWIFDVDTHSDYSGEYAYDSESLDWKKSSGTLEFLFSDLLIPDSTMSLNAYIEKAGKTSLGSLVPYDDRYVAGFRVYMYNEGLQHSFRTAKDRIEEDLDYKVKRDMGGSHHRKMNRQSKYTDIKFRHVLLPYYLSVLLYKGQLYNFVISGHDGTVSGDYPRSSAKVKIAAIVGLLAFVGFIALISEYPISLILMIPFFAWLIFWLRKRGEKI